jgi:hypothetical protein
VQVQFCLPFDRPDSEMSGRATLKAMAEQLRLNYIARKRVYGTIAILAPCLLLFVVTTPTTIAQETPQQQQQEKQRQADEERQRRADADRQRQADEERQRQADADRQRQADEERQRQADADRQRQADEERQRQADADRQRQNDQDRQRQIDAEKEKQRELEQNRQPKVDPVQTERPVGPRQPGETPSNVRTNGTVEPSYPANPDNRTTPERPGDYGIPAKISPPIVPAGDRSPSRPVDVFNAPVPTRITAVPGKEATTITVPDVLAPTVVQPRANIVSAATLLGSPVGISNASASSVAAMNAQAANAERQLIESQRFTEMIMSEIQTQQNVQKGIDAFLTILMENTSDPAIKKGLAGAIGQPNPINDALNQQLLGLAKISATKAQQNAARVNSTLVLGVSSPNPVVASAKAPNVLAASIQGTGTIQNWTASGVMAQPGLGIPAYANAATQRFTSTAGQPQNVSYTASGAEVGGGNPNAGGGCANWVQKSLVITAWGQDTLYIYANVLTGIVDSKGQPSFQGRNVWLSNGSDSKAPFYFGLDGALDHVLSPGQRVVLPVVDPPVNSNSQQAVNVRYCKD